MIADRLLTRLGRLGYVPTAWSLVRIAGFASLGLLLATVVLGRHPGELTSPWNRVSGTDRSQVVSLELGDTRGYRPSSDAGTFHIAWIGGSEILGVDPKDRSIIPGLVNDRIKSVDGRRTSTDVYFQNAMRLGDELSSLRRALAAKPDLVVISLNPVWVLNDLAVQQWGFLDGILAQGSIWPPSRWPVAASLVSPGDVGWKAVSRAVGAVDDRSYWSEWLTDRTSDLSFLDPVPGAKEPAPTGLGQLARRRPVDFWAAHSRALSPGAPLIDTQLSLLARGVNSPSSINDRVLQDMFAAVRRAGVNAYFYMPAISPEAYAEPDGRRSLKQLRDQLAEVTADQTTSAVRFDPQGLQDRVPPTKYRDIVHKLDPAPEVVVLTEDLCALLEDRGHTNGCEAP